MPLLDIARFLEVDLENFVGVSEQVNAGRICIEYIRDLNRASNATRFTIAHMSVYMSKVINAQRIFDVNHQ